MCGASDNRAAQMFLTRRPKTSVGLALSGRGKEKDPGFFPFSFAQGFGSITAAFALE
jgi:hypothetical protein